MKGSGGVVFHVMNRATRGQVLFDGPADYLVFERLIVKAQARTRIRILAYCLMPNHWHFVLWPRHDQEVVEFIRWLTAQHARHVHLARGTQGTGAIYQSRYRAVAVQTETHFYRLISYVERNPVRAFLADRVEDWPWSSGSSRQGRSGIELAEWPVPRPHDWQSLVNGEQPFEDVAFIRVRTAGQKPISRHHLTLADLAVPDPLAVEAP